MPKGKADLVVALEPIESLRVLAQFGNTETIVVSNTRPAYPVGVICGELKYPTIDELKNSLSQLCNKIHFVDATEEAMKLGNPILSNIIMIGAAAGLNVIPIEESNFKLVMSAMLKPDKVEINMDGFRLGKSMIK